MPKVYITRKKLNEDIAINDPNLAQQYLAVKKQIADKRTKKDQLMKSVNQIDNEINILDKNLLAIQTKAAQQQGETVAKQQQQQPEGEKSNTEEQGTNESVNEDFSEEPGLADYREEVIEEISEKYHDAETLVWEFEEILKNCYYDDHPAEICADMIIDADENYVEESGYIGGDTMGKLKANQTHREPIKESAIDYDNVAEVAFTGAILSVNGEEKTVEELGNAGQASAIVFFDDGTSMSMEELQQQDVEFLGEVPEEEPEYEPERWWEDPEEDTKAELRYELQQLQQEREQLLRDMEEDLAGYEETDQPGHSVLAPKPKHDIWGEQLNVIDDKIEEIEKQLAINESVYDEIMDNLEDEKEKIQKIQDFILDVTQKVEIDINTPDEIEVNDEDPEILEPEEVPGDLPGYDYDSDPYDLTVHSEPHPKTPPAEFDIVSQEPVDPFEPTEEESLVNQTLKYEEDKPPYEPELMEEEDIEDEIEMMDYEDEDEPRDEYVFHIRAFDDRENEIIAKIYRDDEDDLWTARVVKGDELPLQNMEFDPRLDKLEIIGELAAIYKEGVEIIDPKEYEYLLDDKEKVDAEYYSDLVEEGLKSNLKNFWRYGRLQKDGDMIIRLIKQMAKNSKISIGDRGILELEFRGEIYKVDRRGKIVFPVGSEVFIDKSKAVQLYNDILDEA